MCGRYYIDSDMADEIEKVVHDIHAGSICAEKV